MLTRERYREDLEKAYEVQVRAGVEVCILMYRKNADSFVTCTGRIERNSDWIRIRYSSTSHLASVQVHQSSFDFSLHDLICVGGTGGRHWLSRVF